METIIEKLLKGILNLNENFYEEIKINSEEIIKERCKEIDDYLNNLN